jgi:hypothetical protein
MSLALDPERTGPEDCACKVVTHAQITRLPQKSLSGVRNFLSVLVASRVAESRMDQTVPFISRSSVARIAHPLELHHYRHVVERLIPAKIPEKDAARSTFTRFVARPTSLCHHLSEPRVSRAAGRRFQLAVLRYWVP